MGPFVRLVRYASVDSPEMTRRQLFCSTLTLPLAAQRRRRRPNIVLLVADDLGYGELGCQGNAEIPTPHIDSIALGGIRFTQGYVTAPFCSPSRAGLLTGRYQTRFGHELNVVGTKNLDEGVGLPLSETTVATRLQEAGYATACLGKWHLGTHPKYHPQRRGFDEFYGFLHEGHYYVPPGQDGVVNHLREKEPPYDANNPLSRGSSPITEREYFTDALAREAVDFVDRHQQKPFFLYVPFNAIHSPMQAKMASQSKFAHIADEHRRVFAGMLSSLDDAVGRILGALRRHGLEQDTLVFFLSDNGGPTAELTSSNRPLRGGKGQLYEGGIRIPYLLQWPRKVKPGQVNRHPVISTDLAPTMLAAAGISAAGATFDGVDLLTQSQADRTFFWRYGRNVALREGRWKLVKQGAGAFQLFDLERDGNETKDLAAAEPETAQRLEAKLNQLNQQMAAPLW